jgi:hypothetical protein
MRSPNFILSGGDLAWLAGFNRAEYLLSWSVRGICRCSSGEGMTAKRPQLRPLPQ